MPGFNPLRNVMACRDNIVFLLCTEDYKYNSILPGLGKESLFLLLFFAWYQSPKAPQPSRLPLFFLTKSASVTTDGGGLPPLAPSWSVDSRYHNICHEGSCFCGQLLIIGLV